MSEEFKVTLSATVNKFKQDLKQASGIAKQFSDRVKQDFGGIKNALSFRLNIKNKDKSYIESEIKAIKSRLERDLTLPVNLNILFSV